MRALTTILNQLLCLLIWFHFTHHFLIPKENSRIREAKMFVLWGIWTFFTATLFWYDTEMKTFLAPFLLYLSFTYMYQHDPKRFIITILVIYLCIFISEIISILLFIVIFQRQLEALNWLDNLLLMPILLTVNYFILDKILKKQGLIADLPNISLLFVFSQIPIMLMIDLSYQQHAPGSLHIAIIILAVLTLFFQMLLWKKRDQYYNIKKHKLMNQKLKELYTQEISAYMNQKNQEQLQRKLRHDLLNEIQVITYMEQDKRKEGKNL